MNRQTTAAALTYLGVVWAFGFIFGVLRELALRPAIGDPWAQLAEAPFMAAVVWITAGWIVRRFPGAAPVAAGLAATAGLLVIETVMALVVMGQTPATYLAGYDVTRGTVFPLLIAWFAVAPWLRRRFGSTAQ